MSLDNPRFIIKLAMSEASNFSVSLKTIILLPIFLKGFLE